MASTPQPTASLRVLLADPDNRRRADLREALATSGHIVVGEATDGDEALALANRLRPDIAVLDAQLPHIDGAEVAHLLNRRAIAPAALLSATQQPEYIRKAILAGAMAIYSAPISTASLVANLPIAVNAWRAEQRSIKQLTVLSERFHARDAVDSAKAVLMNRHGIPESEAYRRLQKSSMNTRQPIRRIAEAVLAAAAVSGQAARAVSGAAL